MERFRFDADAAFTADQELLERVTIAPLTPPGGVQAAIFRMSNPMLNPQAKPRANLHKQADFSRLQSSPQ